MYIIAGLGNPTKKYEHTRHNIGFDVIDYLAKQYNISMSTQRFKGICGTGVIEGSKVLLLKPQTFMNLSGNSVGEAAAFYKPDLSHELIVIYDDIDLAPGNLHEGYYRPSGHPGISQDSGGRGSKKRGTGSGESCAGPFFRGGSGAGG